MVGRLRDHPARYQGRNVIVSAGDLSGCEWPSGKLNPYSSFQMLRPTDSIDDSVFVYQGTFAVPDAAASGRAQQSSIALRQKQPEAALALAREAVAIAPGNLLAQMSLGDAEAETGDRQEAKIAWQTAIQIASSSSQTRRQADISRSSSEHQPGRSISLGPATRTLPRRSQPARDSASHPLIPY